MNETRQVAVQLPATAFERLRHMAAAQNRTYSQVITIALQALDDSTSATSPAGAYARLTRADREPWRERICALRRSGLWPVEIARRLHAEGLTSQHGTPLHVATIRNIVAAGSRKSMSSN